MIQRGTVQCTCRNRLRFYGRTWIDGLFGSQHHPSVGFQEAQCVFLAAG